MFKGKKSQAIFVGIMTFIMVFLTVVVLTQPLKDGIDIARDIDHLDCDNSSISTGTKATCIVTDFSLFYFVGIALGAGGALITGKWASDRLG